MKLLKEPMQTSTNNILAAYRRARQAGYCTDIGWYRKAFRWAKDLAKRSGYSIDVTVGVVAALSPGVQWSVNMRDAESMLLGIKDYVPATYGHNVLKAYRMLKCATKSDVLKVLRPRLESGMKTHNFFLNIRHPLTAGPVTVDRHAISVALGKTSTNKDGNLTKLQYERYAEAYRQAASPLELRPHELQAVVWCWWREQNG